MAEPAGNLRCTITCWLIGLLVGILAIVLLRLIGDFSWPGAIFTGGLLFVVVGALLSVILCRPLPTLAEVQARHAEGSTAGTRKPAAAAPAATATATPAPAAAPAAAPAPAPAPAPAAEVAPEPPPEPAPVSADPSATDSVGEEDKPEMLSGPRDGGADNLKEIKGVGPKLEKLLNSMGVYHFDQIASWTGKEISWVDANLEGFKGRVTRDNWVDQAKVLAAGGDTEFSKRVEDGDVY